jgi:glutamyl-tRNA synthetase
VNVVDDLEMGITHVIRGEDHLSNTPKHIALFRGFGAEPPRYAHIPLILNTDGTKMSKRDTGASLASYLEQGYAPEAVVNYLCLLGWSPKGNREILPIEEVVQLFDLRQILRHNARFDFAKLQWMNAEYLRLMQPERFHALCVQALTQAGIDLGRFDPAYVAAAIATGKGKLKLFSDAPGYIGFYFAEEAEFEPGALRKEFTPESRPRVTRLREALERLETFDAAAVEAEFKAVAGGLGIKVGQLVHPIRVACTGKTVGPSLYHLIEVLGKERVLKRLDRALSMTA